MSELETTGVCAPIALPGKPTCTVAEAAACIGISARQIPLLGGGGHAAGAQLGAGAHRKAPQGRQARPLAHRGAPFGGGRHGAHGRGRHVPLPGGAGRENLERQRGVASAQNPKTKTRKRP